MNFSAQLRMKMTGGGDGSVAGEVGAVEFV